ncbi:MAG: hypothetical protein MI747_22090 [Desulfobacterales bacterium]|nr:hypothetical protein [Desulfobacterales bacterium]
MKVITESLLRATFRKSIPETFKVEAGQILTPSAAQLLSEKGIKIVREEGGEGQVPQARPGKPAKAKSPEYTPVRSYVSAADGGQFEKKPEHMTQLHGNKLVVKDHPRIAFRGELDDFQSLVILAQARAHKAGKSHLVKDLEDILNQCRAMMRADVVNEALPDSTIIGLTDAQLREQSHKPKKFFGCGHILPSYDMGITLVELNVLRSRVRKVEVAAVRAFRNEFELEKPDIIQSLNRMSSAIYIMMLKEKSGQY